MKAGVKIALIAALGIAVLACSKKKQTDKRYFFQSAPLTSTNGYVLRYQPSIERVFKVAYD